MTAVRSNANGHGVDSRHLQRAALCHTLSWVVSIGQWGWECYVKGSLGLLLTTAQEFC